MVKTQTFHGEIKEKRKQGFAVMSPEKKREIARMGGKKAHALGKAHKWTSEEARVFGRKGGSTPKRPRKKG